MSVYTIDSVLTLTGASSHDVKFKPKGGAPPVLQLQNKDGHVVEVCVHVMRIATMATSLCSYHSFLTRIIGHQMSGFG